MRFCLPEHCGFDTWTLLNTAIRRTPSELYVIRIACGVQEFKRRLPWLSCLHAYQHLQTTLGLA